jgi:peptidoglycan/xylan/chitin deacetylase (PgdA/CDA1 family)
MTVHLCFHGVGRIAHEREPGEARYWVGVDVFLRILDLLPGRNEVSLSFDDGNRSDVDTALPALAERGLTATFFPLAGRLQDAASVGRDDLRQLRAQGMLIGTHGWQHTPWRGLDDADARRELIDARTVLEAAAGARITQAALPLGRYDRQLLGRLTDAGYERVFTSDRFRAGENSWLQPRYSVTASDTPDSVLAILDRRAGVRDVVGMARSVVKRLR